MELKVVRFIREASERQLIDLALCFIQRYPAETMELIAEAPEPGMDITPKDVATLPRSVFISEDMLKSMNVLYNGGDKVAVIKQIRTVYNFGLKEAHDLVNYMIDRNYLKGVNEGLPAPPIPVTPRW